MAQTAFLSPKAGIPVGWALPTKPQPGTIQVLCAPIVSSKMSWKLGQQGAIASLTKQPPNPRFRKALTHYAKTIFGFYGYLTGFDISGYASPPKPSRFLNIIQLVRIFQNLLVSIAVILPCDRPNSLSSSSTCSWLWRNFMR